jgi:hypothetical protein
MLNFKPQHAMICGCAVSPPFALKSGTETLAHIWNSVTRLLNLAENIQFLLSGTQHQFLQVNKLPLCRGPDRVQYRCL